MTKGLILKPFYFKLLSLTLIFCLGILVYSNTFHCSFHFDDSLYIIDNFFIRDMRHLQNIWAFYPCRFVAFLSIAFNYHFNQLDVFGYHLFNIAIHLGSAFFIWWFVLMTFSTPAMKEENIARHANIIALLAGLVFVSHPAQIEAVTYICQRAASMAAMFYLISLCLYVKSRLPCQPPGLARFYYFCSLIMAIVAMFTKETAITLPLMVLLYEFSFFETKKNLNWRRIIPFLLTILIIPLTMLLTKSKFFHDIQVIAQGPGGISPVHYLLTQFRVTVTYIRLVFFPLNQNFDYDYPVFKSIFELPVLISFLFLIIIFFWTKNLFSKYRLVSFSIFWFFLTLLPESSFLPEKDVIFEHRLYLPLVGFSMFLVSALYYLLGKNNINMMVFALLMIIAFNSVLTYQRNKFWKDDLTLWGDAVQKSPHKARPYNGLGVAYINQGNFVQALTNFNKAISINPSYANAYNGRGDIYSKQGDWAQALSNYNKAIAINPGYEDAYYNRGIFYERQGNFTQALSDYNKAIEINPDYAEAYYNRGNTYKGQNNFTQSLNNYNKAIEKNPNYEKAYINRGNLYSRQGSFTQAEFDYSKAIAINPEDAQAYINRGTFYAQQGSFIQALSDYNKAIKLNPKFQEAYYNRAVIYYQLREFNKAWTDVHKAEDLGYFADPGFIGSLKKASGKN